MNGLFGDDPGWGVCYWPYIDDVFIWGNTFEELLKRIRYVLSKLREAGFKIRKGKLRIGYPQLPCLGQMVSKAGVSPNEEKVMSIVGMPMPTSLKEVRAFLEMCSFVKK